jgi:formate dehydrogenase subunit delta
MSGDKTVRMANEVARYFAAYPRDVAVTEVRRHLEAFWPRRMRQDALAALERDPARFDPIAADALDAMRAATDSR